MRLVTSPVLPSKLATKIELPVPGALPAALISKSGAAGSAWLGPVIEPGPTVSDILGTG